MKLAWLKFLTILDLARYGWLYIRTSWSVMVVWGGIPRRREDMGGWDDKIANLRPKEWAHLTAINAKMIARVRDFKREKGQTDDVQTD